MQLEGLLAEALQIELANRSNGGKDRARVSQPKYLTGSLTMMNLPLTMPSASGLSGSKTEFPGPTVCFR